MPFVHIVELKLDPCGRADRLQRMDQWCSDFMIGMRAIDPEPGSAMVRLAFDDERMARGFALHWGGVVLGNEEAAAFDVRHDAFDMLAEARP